MLERIDDGLWALATPHSFLGLHVGTRMTVVRLRDGALLLHSPVALDAETRAAVDALGPVAHVVAPNAYHHVYAGEWAAAYPKAKVHAPEALRAKRPDLRVDAVLDAARPDPDWAGALVPHAIDGSMLHETVFVHPATRTVVSADLTENFETSDHWATRQYLKATGIHGKVGLAVQLHLLFRDHKAARRSIDGLLEHDFDRVIISHGRVIDRGGREAVRQTYEGWLK